MVSVIFWHGHHQFVIFEVLYLPLEGGGQLACSNGGGDSYKLFLKVPQVNSQL
jgi:hypothetical protein